MKSTLVILLALGLVSVSASAGDGSFPKIGSSYHLTFPPPTGEQSIV